MYYLLCIHHQWAEERVWSVITKVSFLQLVRGAHPTSEPRRDLQSGDYLISQCGGEPFLLCSCWQPRVGFWPDDDKWVLSRISTIMTESDQWSSGPCDTWYLSWWPHHPLSGTSAWDCGHHHVTDMMMMRLWQWLMSAPGDTRPPLTPLPLLTPCQPPELGPGSRGCPGPAGLWLEAGASQCGTRVSCARSVTSSLASSSSHHSDLSDPILAPVSCVSSWRQEWQEDTSSVIRTSRPRRSGQKPAPCLPDSEIIPLVG